MCGIAGFWTLSGNDSHKQHLREMTNAIAHRGPDASGYWSDSDSGIYLGHRRLSIVDLSEAGVQPMVSKCGRYVLAFNGEVYNHKELRKVLEKETGIAGWRGESDTETLLSAISRWGLDSAIARVSGMFAVVLWDRRERSLTLCRDRLGEKPLYYGFIGKYLYFASELKAINAHCCFKGVVSKSAVAEFINHSRIAAPNSIYEALYKVKAGSFVKYRSPDSVPEIEIYWQLPVKEEENTLSESDAIARLDQLIGEAVKRQMDADVPLGAFLSGGYDSSLVVAQMAKYAPNRVRTFAIGFSNPLYDEAPFAERVAKYLDTDHTEFYVDDRAVIDTIERLADIWDEPFADPSQIPTYIVSELTRREVTVSLSGDGGDELFAGYDRYIKAVALWDRVKRNPNALRGVADTASAGLGMLYSAYSGDNKCINRLFSILETATRRGYILGSRNQSNLYIRLINSGQFANHVLLESGSNNRESFEFDSTLDFVSNMCRCDLENYLPETILTKVDRASMAVSLESRAPILDPAVVEFAWRLPTSLKIDDTGGKSILRKLVHRYLPQEMMDRPKKGFGIPLPDLLQGPLRDLGEDLLSERELESGGFFHPRRVRRLWDIHQSRGSDNYRLLWNLMVFQLWLRSVGNN